MKFGEVEFERRAFPRFTLHVPFTYTLENNTSGVGVTDNASQGGLMGYLPEPVQPEDRIRMQITLTESARLHQVAALVRVVWIKKTLEEGARAYKIGLEFLEISSEDLNRLRGFEQIWLEQAG